MKKLGVFALFVAIAIVVVSCAAPTPAPTPVPPTAAPVVQPTTPPQPTKAPEATKPPAPTTAPTVAPTTAPTAAPTTAAATAAPASGPIKIGFFSPLTGDTAADGQSAFNSAKLAIKLINDAGGVNGRQLQLINYDDAGKPDQAASIARKLIESDQVVAVVSGAYSGPTRAAAPVFQQAGMVMLSGYAIHPDITKAGDKIFRIGTLADVQGRVGAELVAKNLHAKNVAVLIIDNDYGVSLTAGFKAWAPKVGINVVFEQKYSFGEKDFRPIIEKIKSLNPDAIYATGYYAEASTFLSQAKDAGLKMPIVGQEGYDSPELFKLAGDSAEGVIITTDLNRDGKEPMTQKFLSEYKKAYNEEADMVGASAFDAVQVLAYAFKTGGVNTGGIQKALLGLKDFHDVATGPFLYYTPDREVVRPVSSQIVKSGAFHLYQEFTDPSLTVP